MIGVVAAVLGVAGGELLIPTLVLLFGADIKLAGSLSSRSEPADDDRRLHAYSRDHSFAVLGENKPSWW